MKRLFHTVAVLVALGSATPALASDVTGDRHSPRNAQPQARVTAVEARQPAAAAEEAPCACACMKQGPRRADAERAPGRH